MAGLLNTYQLATLTGTVAEIGRNLTAHQAMGILPFPNASCAVALIDRLTHVRTRCQSLRRVPERLQAVFRDRFQHLGHHGWQPFVAAWLSI